MVVVEMVLVLVVSGCGRDGISVVVVSGCGRDGISVCGSGYWLL